MEPMEVDGIDPCISSGISDNDAAKLSSASESDVEELYPSECEDHCEAIQASVQEEMSTSDSSALYPSDVDDENPLKSKYVRCQKE